MKAYYVREILESLKFDRGLDPKVSMDIGISSKLRWNKFYPGEDFLPADEVIKYLKNPKLIPYIIKGLRNQPEWTIDYQVKVFNYLIDHKGSALYKDLVPRRAIPKQTMHRIFKELFNKGILTLERIGNTYTVYLNKINESINFERGQDPKKSMDIGKYHNNFFKDLENTYSYYDYAMRQDSDSIERLILKQASIFLKVPPEKVLAIDSSNLSLDLLKLNVIKKETIETSDTLPVIINLTDRGIVYVNSSTINRMILCILGTKY